MDNSAIHFSSEFDWKWSRIKKRKNKAFLYDQVRYLIEHNTLNSPYIGSKWEDC